MNSLWRKPSTLTAAVIAAVTFIVVVNPAQANSVTVVNGNFETGPWGSSQIITGWTEPTPGGGDNYNESRDGSINSNVLHLKGNGGNWVGQNLTLSDEGSIDATSYASYSVTFSYGHRADVSENWGQGDITLRVALWNTTTSTELAGYNLVITDPNEQQTPQWQEIAKQVELNYANTSQTSGDVLQLRFTHVSPTLASSWMSTAMIDDISVTTGSADDLTISSGNNLNASGALAGPFTPSSITYTLTNSGDQPLDWSATKAATWLTLNTSSGTLASGATADLIVSINSAADALAVGSYADTLTISNLTSSVDQTRTANLDIILPPGDTDNDGLPNQWEFDHGLDPNDDGSTNPDNGAAGDPDNDGLPNDEEYFMNSDPQVNESGKAWQPRPDKVSLMVINAHPDDEGIFFGGLIPYYTQVRELPVVSISMTSGDWSREPEVREAEFRNAVWAYGLRVQPIFPRFKDYSSSLLSSLDDNWDVWADGLLDGDGSDVEEGKEKATRALAKWIRKYRPDVVATHDLNGEYGHYNHQATAWATVWAVAMAANPSVDIEELPSWQVKKLYINNYATNRIFHDFWQNLSIDTTGNGTADATPIDVANMGLNFHVTQRQPNASTCYAVNETNSSWEPFPCEWWGLYSTTVGSDTIQADFTAPDADNDTTIYSGWAKGDFFEHLPAFADSDADGLPDNWETTHSVSDPTADDDGDGINNLDEFISGLNPRQQDRIELITSSDSASIQFTVPASTPTGYDAYTRTYQLFHSTNMQAWTSVTVKGVATGSPVIYAEVPQDGSPHFYRLQLNIE